MLTITIDLNKADFEDIDFENDEDREYILDSYKSIIENEENNLEDIINDSPNPIDTINSINDNRGELYIMSEDGDREYSLGFYTNITI